MTPHVFAVKSELVIAGFDVTAKDAKGHDARIARAGVTTVWPNHHSCL